jgi:hypothetical protein
MKAIILAILEAWARAFVRALQDWVDKRERDALIRNETTAINDLEDTRADQTEADRITRAVDAVRSDDNGGVRRADPGTKPDTRGYRD